MAQESKDTGRESKNINDAIRKRFEKLPDPLHIELPHHHKKLLEALFIIGVAALIILLLMLGSMRVLDTAEANASAMLVLLLSVFLGIMIFEKSMITAVSHRPKKSSS